MMFNSRLIDGLFRIILALHSTVSEQTCEPCELLRCWKPRVWGWDGWDCFCWLYGCFMNVLRIFFLDLLSDVLSGFARQMPRPFERNPNCRIFGMTPLMRRNLGNCALHALKMECSKMECRAVWVFLILWPKWISEFVSCPSMIILSILIRSQWSFSTMLFYGGKPHILLKAKGHGQAAALGP